MLIHNVEKKFACQVWVKFAPVTAPTGHCIPVDNGLFNIIYYFLISFMWCCKQVII